MKSILILFVALFPAVAMAETRIISNGCAKNVATGKVYQASIRIVDGKELWPKYSWAKLLTKYAVVPVESGEPIYIDLGSFGFLSESGNKGMDRQGNAWIVAKTPWC